jgi:NAD(P)-dependent dehydrogenase (short-subunit alcohol dehydrogenase family)
MKPLCLITGATDGVGKSTALLLTQRGFRVVMVARSASKAEAVQRELADATGEQVEYLIADLASLRQVRALGARFRKEFGALDVLINNAGVFLPERTQTEDGFETTYQVNYLSHFLLTQLLLEPLEQASQGRIINVSSSVMTMARFDADNLQSEKRFSVFGTYAASKLLMLMFTKELARRLGGTRVTANAVHPGIVRTPMMLSAPGVFRALSLLSLPFSISPQKGARASVHLATAPELATVSGQYFAGAKPSSASSKFDTAANRARLWELSLESLGGAAAATRRAG